MRAGDFFSRRFLDTPNIDRCTRSTRRHALRTASLPVREDPFALTLTSIATLTAHADTPHARLSLGKPYIPYLTSLLASYPSSPPPRAASRCRKRELAVVHGQAVTPLAMAVEAAGGTAISMFGTARAGGQALLAAARQLAALLLVHPLRHALQESASARAHSVVRRVLLSRTASKGERRVERSRRAARR